MELSRRDFLRLSGAGTGGFLLYGFLNQDEAFASPRRLPLKKKIGEKTTICPYCGVGCGAIMAVEDGKIIHIEGDPDNPINEGSLCSKGASLRQVAGNEQRLTKVLYRAPDGLDWEEKTWDWALEQVARRIKETRDANWTGTDGDGHLVNRTEAIANLGGSALDNEECYLLSKLTRALGVVYLEHHARI